MRELHPPEERSRLSTGRTDRPGQRFRSWVELDRYPERVICSIHRARDCPTHDRLLAPGITPGISKAPGDEGRTTPGAKSIKDDPVRSGRTRTAHPPCALDASGQACHAAALQRVDVPSRVIVASIAVAGSRLDPEIAVFVGMIAADRDPARGRVDAVVHVAEGE